MVDLIEERLNKIELFLKRIETKLDTLIEFEKLSLEEKKEILKIKKEMDIREINSYEDAFN
ncbi:MAG: hypothetical protein LAT82_04415 [Nanoarchaeota archaeon]|nr:hypothetical protein [Nanoarchaeota archaeon]